MSSKKGRVMSKRGVCTQNVSLLSVVLQHACMQAVLFRRHQIHLGIGYSSFRALLMQSDEEVSSKGGVSTLYKP